MRDFDSTTGRSTKVHLLFPDIPTSLQEATQFVHICNDLLYTNSSSFSPVLLEELPYIPLAMFANSI